MDWIFRASLRGSTATRGTTEAIPGRDEIAALPSVARNDRTRLTKQAATRERTEGETFWRAYLIPIGFLMAAALFQIPFFTSYISPITNFYRILYTGFFWSAGFPAEFSVLAISGFVLTGFLLLDFVRPRLWCRSLCPVGKVYGLFNWGSRLHVETAGRNCQGCGLCEEACYMVVKILPVPPKKIRNSSCILCGRCVDACRGRENILKMKIW